MRHGDRGGKSLLWGLFLIAVGAAFLVVELGLLELPSVWNWWPVALVVLGGSHLLEGRPGSGIAWMLVGGWFFVARDGWLGLSYRNSWPLLIVIGGIGIVLRALTGEDRRRRTARGAS